MKEFEEPEIELLFIEASVFTSDEQEGADNTSEFEFP